MSWCGGGQTSPIIGSGGSSRQTIIVIITDVAGDLGETVVEVRVSGGCS